MLKIKDNVDLKELEKFGYRSNYPTTNPYICRLVKEEELGKNYLYSIYINKRTRRIETSIDIINSNGMLKNIDEFSDELFDLIQAGLVEKVADNE